MKQHLEDAFETIDAAVFTGDFLLDTDSVSVMMDYINSWHRAAQAHHKAHAQAVLTAKQWEKIPSKFNFAACDADGDWFAYCSEPSIGEYSWFPTSRETARGLRSLFVGSGLGDFLDVSWRDSLTERPTN
jgi:hypothetical protein